MANNPFDPPVVQIMKQLERGRIATSNRGFGSIRTPETVSRAAGVPTTPENFSELDDVNMSGLVDGQIAVWDEGSGSWVPTDMPSGGGGGSVSDPSWTIPTDWTSIDEFDDEEIHADWTLVAASTYAAGAEPVYVEGNGVLSVAYDSGVKDGGTARQHAIVRPMSPMAVGDAIITNFRTLVRNNAYYRMMGLALSTSGVTASGNQLYARWWVWSGGGSTGARALVGWAGDTVLDSGFNYPYIQPLYQRIVRLSTTTWRVDYSPDGLQWMKGSVLTWAFEPTHVGFAHSNWNTTTLSVGSYEFIRRVSGVS